MILYAIPVSTYSAKVRIALGIKDIDYDMVPARRAATARRSTRPSSPSARFRA